MKNFLFLILVFSISSAYAQGLKQKIENAYKTFESDPQMRYASGSLSVLNAETGDVIYSANGNTGLASASTLKTITSASAYHFLGKDFTWETTLGYSGSISANGTLNGDIIITGGGDPALGSDRYDQSRSDQILNKWADALTRTGIKNITGQIIADDRLFGTETMPGGWTWQDMGNYYGAGPSSLTWRENQFDMHFKSGRVGEPAELVRTDPEMSYLKIVNEVKTGAPGTGDNVYAYSAPFSTVIYLRGTYGVDLKKAISASVPDPAFDLAYRLQNKLRQSDIQVENGVVTARVLAANRKPLLPQAKIISVHTSPPLHEIVYWFNQKSINLFGEHLIKTIAWKEGKDVTISQGTELVKDFWSKRIGIDPASMNIYDGSGLSPANRVSTMAMARILQSLKKEIWFESYFNSLPQYNNMKMKSGTISDVIAYTGYHTSASGTPMVFSFMINNYNGSSSGIRQKMFRVLNTLK
ncbi:MAG TPA: D-alanyl-D-alanine carboxypeptidase/D-alanyl-D-alanine-endopeptidase [Daejeonella sp.]|uniref:D-alanyl-D-alanine carboxypeptidase/D-alanyl-D-alanine endopeptidase n=1 Tax=Daejeonella sp. TaxID=2805397 RepID=UPI00269285FB|nr:D-alanyl-D-alanine carboxypeptidase/D-alanyl-D-alanine-endopeptidase [Daejeonella sp.]HQS51432.1 D-alanyl-D-alanine carboxypeptidase/D-alanyl-D-alanine-endopeptidase [Daejeonella sp.]HQT22633.1 D-alanyl-D-alanine carboxypeptidase/D-alanyl-D-alanine-endopeptidase [Daejeonella sp.]HQT57677.1 D-alanyl-D-alanine carboxypeptidase/D-alanyl-D-alanine-endopeptidase [Daejeonella sp.]